MNYEVEQKFRISDFSRIEADLKKLGATKGKSVEQVDTYFAHPMRDFAQTDEALRIRRVGDKNVVTYKGPKIDRETKTRQEIEIAFAEGTQEAKNFASLLGSLSFTKVSEVRKTRIYWNIDWASDGASFPFVIALDSIKTLGTFVELETTASEETLPAAKKALQSLATALCLVENERRSYLELLLDAPFHD